MHGTCQPVWLASYQQRGHSVWEHPLHDCITLLAKLSVTHLEMLLAESCCTGHVIPHSLSNNTRDYYDPILQRTKLRHRKVKEKVNGKAVQ